MGLERIVARLRSVTRVLRADLSGASTYEITETNIKLAIYHGIVGIMSVNVAAPFIGILAVKLGASEFQVGLLSSGPAVVALFSMIPGAKVLDRIPRKKWVIRNLILANRFFYVFIATIPLFSRDLRAWLLVGAVSLMNLPGSISNIGWQAFIAEVVPPERRAHAFAMRNRAMNLVGTIIVLLTGRFIDMTGFPLGYQIAFSLAFLLALAEAWVFSRMVEPGEAGFDESPVSPGEARVSGKEVEPGVFGSIVSDIRMITTRRRFIGYLVASILFYLAWQIPWPLFTLYQVKVLGANNLWVSILNLVNTSGSLIGYGFWVKMIQKKGNLMTLFLSSIWIFTVPLVYAFSRSLVTVAVFNLLSGVIFSGVNLCLFNVLLEVTPEEHRTVYIAYYTTAINASAIVAPMIGVLFLDLWGYFWAFLVCAGIRIIGSLTFFILNYLDSRRVAGFSSLS